MELLRLELTGRTGQVQTPPGSPPHELGLLGVDVRTLELEGQPHLVVQALFDDDTPGFDHGLLHDPLVADVFDAGGGTVLRELFDHDRFRRALHADREAGENELRGVLVRTDGELPPHYVRLAFLPLRIEDTDGTVLVIRRAGVDELVAGVEVAHARGEVTDVEREAMLVTIEQRHGPLDR